MENTTYQQIYEIARKQKYFDITLAQAEDLFTEYSHGNQDAARLLKTGLTSFALKMVGCQQSITLHKLSIQQKYAAALDLLDKLLVPYISSNRGGFNTFYCPRLSGWLQAALSQNKYNETFFDTQQYSPSELKQLTEDWLTKGAIAGQALSPQIAKILSQSILPALPNDSKELLDGILKFPTLPQVWCYAGKQNPNQYEIYLELMLDQALNILTKVDINLKQNTPYSVSNNQHKQTSFQKRTSWINAVDERTQISLNQRKLRYAAALADVDVEDLKAKINNPNYSYVIDEYMLCKNELSAREITSHLHTSNTNVQYMAKSVLKKVSLMQNGLTQCNSSRPSTIQKRRERFAKKLQGINLDKLRDLLDDTKRVVLDEYMLCLNNLTPQQILQKIHKPDICFLVSYAKTIVNISSNLDKLEARKLAKAQSQEKRDSGLDLRKQKSLQWRKQTYASALDGIDIELFKTKLNNPQYSYIIDEYILCKNNLSVADICKHINKSYVTVINTAKAIQHKAKLMHAGLDIAQIKTKDSANRNDRYKEKLQGIDLDKLRQTLDDKLCYVLDEYMLGKNNLTIKQMLEHLNKSDKACLPGYARTVLQEANRLNNPQGGLKRCTIKSLDQRKHTYAAALEGVDIDLLKSKINNPNYSYVIDEYMLCKNNLPSSVISNQLGKDVATIKQMSSTVLKKAELLKRGLDVCLASDDHFYGQRIEKFAKALQGVNLDQLREKLDDQKRYILDEYMLGLHKLSPKQIAKNIGRGDANCLSFFAKTIVNIAKRPPKAKKIDCVPGVNIVKEKSLQHRKSKYAAALLDVDVELLKTKINNPIYSYIIDEYMLCKNNLSTTQIAQNINQNACSIRQIANVILNKAHKLKLGLNVSSKVLVKTIDKRKEKYAKQLEGIDIVRLREALDDKKRYILDEYMLCSNHLSAGEIAKKVSITRTSDFAYLTKNILNVGKNLDNPNFRSSSSGVDLRKNNAIQKRKEKYAAALADVDIELLKTKLNSPEQSYIIDEFMLCKSNLPTSVIAENINKSRIYIPTIANNILRKVNLLKMGLDNTLATGSVITRTEKYVKALQGVNLGKLRESLDDTKRIVLDEYMLGLNNLSIEEIELKTGLSSKHGTLVSAAKSIVNKSKRLENPSITSEAKRQKATDKRLDRFAIALQNIDIITLEKLLNDSRHYVLNEYMLGKSGLTIDEIANTLQKDKTYLSQIAMQIIKLGQKAAAVPEPAAATLTRKLKYAKQLRGVDVSDLIQKMPDDQSRIILEEYMLCRHNLSNEQIMENFGITAEVLHSKSKRILNIAQGKAKRGRGMEQADIQKRLALYAPALQDIDLAAFKASIGSAAYLFIIDEYMLCKNNMSTNLITQNLDISKYQLKLVAEQIVNRAKKFAAGKQVKAIKSNYIPEQAQLNSSANIQKAIARVSTGITKLNLLDNILPQLNQDESIAFGKLFPQFAPVTQPAPATTYSLHQLEVMQSNLALKLDDYITSQHIKLQLQEQLNQGSLLQDVKIYLQSELLQLEFLTDVLLSDRLDAKEQFMLRHNIKEKYLPDLEDSVFDAIDKISDRQSDVLDFIDSCDTTAVDGTPIEGIDFLLKVFAPAVLEERELEYLKKYMLDYRYSKAEEKQAQRQSSIKFSIQQKLNDYKAHKAEADELVHWAGGYQRIVNELVPKLKNEDFKTILFNEVIGYFPTPKKERITKYGPELAKHVKAIKNKLLNRLSIMSVSAYNSGRTLKSRDDDEFNLPLLDDYDDNNKHTDD